MLHADASAGAAPGRGTGASLLVPRPGITAVVGSGGKTTLLALLAARAAGTVALTTTTHVRPFDGVPTLLDPTEADVVAALARSRVVCVGAPADEDALGHSGDRHQSDQDARALPAKLAAPALAPAELARVAEHVLVEADGSRGLPLKAHEAWEPVVPAGCARVVLVVGASGLGHPVGEVAHRAGRFCALAGCDPADAATPGLVARVIQAERARTQADVVLVNQTDTPGLLAAAAELARALGEPVWAGSLRAGQTMLLAP